MSYRNWPEDKKEYKRCYETHPPLPLGDGLVIYGGSCSHPVVKDADIYVGFDLGHKRSPKAYPWVDGESFLYPIRDMHAPEDPESFFQLVDWIALQLIAQKKVHLGCIGGHGRTGTVLSALVNVLMDEPDAISYVRVNYCKKVVESEAQVSFLHKHFGIKKVVGAKSFSQPRSVSDHKWGEFGDPKPKVSTKLKLLDASPSKVIWSPQVKLVSVID